MRGLGAVAQPSASLPDPCSLVDAPDPPPCGWAHGFLDYYDGVPAKFASWTHGKIAELGYQGAIDYFAKPAMKALCVQGRCLRKKAWGRGWKMYPITWAEARRLAKNRVDSSVHYQAVVPEEAAMRGFGAAAQPGAALPGVCANVPLVKPADQQRCSEAFVRLARYASPETMTYSNWGSEVLWYVEEFGYDYAVKYYTKSIFASMCKQIQCMNAGFAPPHWKVIPVSQATAANWAKRWVDAGLATKPQQVPKMGVPQMRGYGTYRAQRGGYRLPPPQLAPGLPRGTEKGGIFDAEWLPAEVVNMSYPTVPSDSPHIASVPQKVGPRVGVGFREMTPRPVRAASGYGAYVTNGQANQPPIPIGPAGQPGAVESGIFGSYAVGPMQSLPIPQAAQVMQPRAVRSGVLGQLPMAPGPAGTVCPTGFHFVNYEVTPHLVHNLPRPMCGRGQAQQLQQHPAATSCYQWTCAPVRRGYGNLGDPPPVPIGPVPQPGAVRSGIFG